MTGLRMEQTRPPLDWHAPPAPDEDERDPFFAPVWEQEPDAPGIPLARRPRPAASPLPDTGLLDLLVPLCEAQDVLARLDARAAVAPPAILEGLLNRMALAEAAGWLAHSFAWINPLDLALRELDLIGGTALAMLGGGHRHAWETQQLAFGDQAVTEAVALARLLRRDPATRRAMFDAPDMAREALGAFGGHQLDAERFAQWRADGQAESALLPPLLRAARAAQGWMDAGAVEFPTPVQALLAALWLVARDGPLRCVFLPVWAAYPAVGRGESSALPRLRVGGGLAAAGWAGAFLRLVAESALAALRELERLETLAARAQALTGRADRRSRVADVVREAIRLPIVTPKTLVSRLGVVPQTATGLLRDLETAGLIREVTGRRSFKAFAA